MWVMHWEDYFDAGVRGSTQTKLVLFVPKTLWQVDRISGGMCMISAASSTGVVQRTTMHGMCLVGHLRKH